ncbi:hypothetical protein [Rhodovulum bhavnagarense]|nr:hypothetical protein [Rhodovulum bhavnagarense]
MHHLRDALFSRAESGRAFAPGHDGVILATLALTANSAGQSV